MCAWVTMETRNKRIESVYSITVFIENPDGAYLMSNHITPGGDE